MYGKHVRPLHSALLLTAGYLYSGDHKSFTTPLHISLPSSRSRSSFKPARRKHSTAVERLLRRQELVRATRGAGVPVLFSFAGRRPADTFSRSRSSPFGQQYRRHAGSRAGSRSGDPGISNVSVRLAGICDACKRLLVLVLQEPGKLTMRHGF